jgi:hypothetical protein
VYTSELRRAAKLKWEHAPPGLNAVNAATFLAKLQAGKSIRDMVGSATGEDYICSHTRFTYHAKQNPAWGAECRRLSYLTACRRKSENQAMRKRTQTHCASGLHLMTLDNVAFHGTTGYRYCIACRRATDRRVPTPLTQAEKQRIVGMFATGRPVNVSLIIHGKVPGGGGKRVKPIVLAKDFYHARATDAAFDRFITDATVDSQSKGQSIRYARERRLVDRSKAEQDARDYFEVAAMIPRGFSDDSKFDVVHEVLIEYRAGKITRDQWLQRVRFYMKEANKMFAPKYPKFGNAMLLSLDAPAYLDSPVPLVETVAEGLWG